MKPQAHLLASAVAGIMVYWREPHKALIVTAAGVLIDLDHYLLYALRSGDWVPYNAIRYNRRRHGQPDAGDARPRFGSLRSALHQPALALPLIALFASWRATRPLAIALALHLLMDTRLIDLDWRVYRRSRGRCELCGAAGVQLGVFYIERHTNQPDPLALTNRIGLCLYCTPQLAYIRWAPEPLHQLKTRLAHPAQATTRHTR